MATITRSNMSDGLSDYEAGRQSNRTSWLDEQARRVDREVFTSPEIYALEMERIFNRSWLYLGHESEVAEPGNFVLRRMGVDEVVVTRGKDREVRAFLNACIHRGAKVCRADAGTTPLFVCPYHSWTYDGTTGALQTTSFDFEYDKAEIKTRRLKQVPRVESYKGLIFGCWDADAVTLKEYLGDLAWYIDVVFGNTPEGMVALSLPQRWEIATNWKIGSLNFMDGQHAMRTHKGPLIIGQAWGRPPVSAIVEIAREQVPQAALPGGHGVMMGSGGPPGASFFGYPQDLIPLHERTLTPEQFECLANHPPFIGTVFPNLSWVGNPNSPDARDPFTFLSLRLWQPLGPGRIEVWSWNFAPKEASDETKAMMERVAVQNFGMGGRFEEDDAQVWSEAYSALKGPNALDGTCDFSAGRAEQPLADARMPGAVYKSAFGEHGQFGFIRHWNNVMTGAL